MANENWPQGQSLKNVLGERKPEALSVEVEVRRVSWTYQYVEQYKPQ